MGHYSEQYEAEAERQEIIRQLSVLAAVDALNKALTTTREVPDSREKSLAITHIETAILWLKK